MTDFGRLLRELDREELRVCARGLLEYLETPEGVGAAARNGGGVEAQEPAPQRREAGAAGGVGARRAVAPETERAQARSGREAYGGGVGKAARKPEWNGEYEYAGSAGGARVAGAERRERGMGAYESKTRERSGAAGASDEARGAAFCGPERRYDGAVGARGMEMSRVSEYFKRDSRRYGALR